MFDNNELFKITFDDNDLLLQNDQDNNCSFKDNVVGNFGLLDLISALIWIKVRNIPRSFMFLQT